MSRVLYFDCFSGISGDMTLGALIDAGLPLDDLTRALGSLALGDVELRAEKVLRTGVSATKFSVHAIGKSFLSALYGRRRNRECTGSVFTVPNPRFNGEL